MERTKQLHIILNGYDLYMIDGYDKDWNVLPRRDDQTFMEWLNQYDGVTFADFEPKFFLETDLSYIVGV